jgi:hypothetical protein
VVPVCLALASLFAAVGHAAGERDALVRPGVGIGKIRLGMTPAQVFRALGRTPLVNRRIDYGFGNRYVEYGWDYTVWTVGFTGRRNNLRVSKVATTLRTERTTARVGVGSTVPGILRAYPSASCAFRVPPSPDLGTWVYVGRRPRVTAFNVVYSGNARRGRVAEVVVQRDWLRPSRTRRCLGDWRTR